MTKLSYRIQQRGSFWVMSCECVPINRFDTKNAAIEAGRSIVAEARERGDQANLIVADIAHNRQTTGITKDSGIHV